MLGRRSPQEIYDAMEPPDDDDFPPWDGFADCHTCDTERKSKGYGGDNCTGCKLVKDELQGYTYNEMDLEELANEYPNMAIVINNSGM